MAGIPSGVTKSESPLENLLSDLIENLSESEKSKVLSYQEELKASKKQVLDLQRERNTREEAAESFGLSREVIEKSLKVYDESIEMTSKKFLEASKNIAGQLEGFTSSSSLSDEQISNVKAYIEMSKNTEDIQEAVEEFSKSSKEPSKMVDTFKSSVSSITDSLLNSSLGMFSVITSPLEDLLGIKVNDMIKGGFSKIFKRKEKEEDAGEFLQKKVPARADNLKRAGLIGSAAVFISESINKLLGRKGVSGEDSGLGDFAAGSLASSTVRGLGPALLKGAGIASLAGGILWGVIDGIIAVGEADNWGVSKISASLGGFFGGTGEGGDIKDAFKNAGKFAMTGAGVGMLTGGPIGALAGGLAGAVLGGVLGWIGGENIAQFFQGVGDWFKEQLANVKTWLNENTEDIELIKTSVIQIGRSLFGPLIDGFSSVFSGITFRFNSIKEILGDDELTFWQKTGSIGKEIILGIVEVPYNFVKGGLSSFFGSRWTTMSDILGDDELTVWQKIGSIGKEIIGGIVDRIVSFTDGILIGADATIKLFLNDEWDAKYEIFKTKIGEWFSLIIDPIVGGITGFFSGWKTRFENISEIAFDEDKSLWKKVLGVVRELILGVLDGPFNIVKGWIDGMKDNKIFQDLSEKFTSWFTNIADSIGEWIWSILPGFLQKGLQFVGLGKDQELKGSKNPTPDEAAYYTNADYAKKSLPVPETVGTNQGIIDKYSSYYGTEQPIKETQSKEDEGFFKKTGAFFKDFFKDSFKGLTSSVEDAIIYKDGQIIKTHPEDSIVATQNSPILLNENKQAAKLSFNPYSESYKSTAKEVTAIQTPIEISDNPAFNKMVTLLSSILDTLKDKEMAPSITELRMPGKLDFELLR
jgi:hypothetical protein